MKKIIVSLTGFLALLIIATLVVAPGQSMASAEQVSAANSVSAYLQNLKNSQWDHAYQLTSEKFREIIPLKAFGSRFERSDFAGDLVDFDIGEVVVMGDIAQVEVSYSWAQPDAATLSNGQATVTVVREQAIWHVNPKWEDFLPSKLATQDSLAIARGNDVSVSIQYILLYPATENYPAVARVRLDISNDNSNTVRWQFPEAGATNSYLRDKDTGLAYYPSAGGGAMGTNGGAFSIDREERIITLAPGARGSVFIYLENVPETVRYFDMVFGGFAFPDANVTWEIAFTDIPFYADSVPD